MTNCARITTLRCVVFHEISLLRIVYQIMKELHIQSSEDMTFVYIIFNKTGNLRINKIRRRVCLTIVAVKRQ